MTEEVRPAIGALFIPTPGIIECKNYFVVQKLIEHRVRSILTESGFSDISKELVLHFLTPPEKATNPEKLNKFVDYEAQELLNTFNLYEQTPDYQTAIEGLIPHKGKTFSIVSITNNGLQVLINV